MMTAGLRVIKLAVEHVREPGHVAVGLAVFTGVTNTIGLRRISAARKAAQVEGTTMAARQPPIQGHRRPGRPAAVAGRLPSGITGLGQGGAY